MTTKETILKYISDMKLHIEAMIEIKEKTAEYFREDSKRQEALQAMMLHDKTVMEQSDELDVLMEKLTDL